MMEIDNNSKTYHAMHSVRHLRSLRRFGCAGAGGSGCHTANLPTGASVHMHTYREHRQRDIDTRKTQTHRDNHDCTRAHTKRI